jgi:hypothetical protein
MRRTREAEIECEEGKRTVEMHERAAEMGGGGVAQLKQTSSETDFFSVMLTHGDLFPLTSGRGLHNYVEVIVRKGIWPIMKDGLP